MYVEASEDARRNVVNRTVEYTLDGRSVEHANGRVRGRLQASYEAALIPVAGGAIGLPRFLAARAVAHRRSTIMGTGAGTRHAGMDEAERERRDAYARVRASFRLEAQALTPDEERELEPYFRGEVSLEEVTRRAIERFRVKEPPGGAHG